MVLFPQSILTVGRSENKNAMQFSMFEDEIRPGVVNIPENFLFIEVKIFVLIKQDGHIWLHID